MKKQIIAAILMALLLASCGGNNDKGTAETGSGTKSPSESPVETTAPGEEATKGESPSEEDASGTTKATFVSIPGEVLYSDDNNVGVKAPHGGLYFNGNEVNSEAFDILVEQHEATVSPDYATSPDAYKDLPEGMKPSTTKKPSSTTDKKPSSTTGKKPSSTTTGKKPATTTTGKKPDVTTEDPFKDLPTEEVTEQPTGSIFIDEEDHELAKYVSTGKTDLKITKVEVYNSAKPGIKGIESFTPGDTFLINIWCNADARLDSTIYLVPRVAEHKNSYAKAEVVTSQEMFTAAVSGKNQIFCEVKIPAGVPSGVYELRFVCGTEEGYIPFHIGASK